jgi:hypothetical protein
MEGNPSFIKGLGRDPYFIRYGLPLGRKKKPHTNPPFLLKAMPPFIKGIGPFSY